MLCKILQEKTEILFNHLISKLESMNLKPQTFRLKKKKIQAEQLGPIGIFIDNT